MPLQHADELLDFLRARLGSFHRLDPEQDRVSVRAVQGREKRLRFRVCVERALFVLLAMFLVGAFGLLATLAPGFGEADERSALLRSGAAVPPPLVVDAPDLLT